MRRSTWRQGLLRLLLVALAVVGCGVPSGEVPSQVDRAEVPYELLEEASPTRTPLPALPDRAEGPRAFFLTDDDRLVGVPPAVPAGPALSVAVGALSSGPDRASRGRGLRTAIPPGLALVVTRVENGTATIDLRGEPAPVGEQSPLAVAQIVLTATSAPGVDRVLLTRSGQPLEAQLPDGGLTAAPLSASDYAVLLAPP